MTVYTYHGATDGLTYVFDSDNHTLTISGNGMVADLVGGSKLNTSESGSVSIGTSSGKIIQGTFYNVILNNGVTGIADHSNYSLDAPFRGLGGGTAISVSLPNTFTYAGTGAFSFCFNGMDLYYTLPNSLTSIADAAFAMTYARSVSVPESVTSYGGGIFMSAGNLKLVQLPSHWTTIKLRTFYGAGGNSEVGSLAVLLPSSLTTIESYAFAETTSSTTNARLILSAFPSTLRTIGDSAFYKSGLTTVTIPASVTTIGQNAFKYSGLLTTIVFEGGPYDLTHDEFTLNVSTYYYRTVYSHNKWAQTYLQTHTHDEGGQHVYVHKFLYYIDLNTDGSVGRSYVKEAESMTLPSRTPPTGFVFGGWWSAPTGGTKYGDAGQQFTPTSDATLYARWEPIIVTVELTAVGGGTVTGAGQYNHGSTVTIEAIPSLGSEFVSWSDGNTNSTRTFTATSNVVLSALFERVAPWIRIKISNVWTEGITYVRYNDQWTLAKKVFVKENDEWHESL